MRRTRATLKPWIEDMITTYGTETATADGQLKAQVAGEGRMTESQVQGARGAAGWLFLTDGVVHIPAVLTQNAWEQLQDQEDRECLTSLIHSTVCMTSYRLQFHMAAEQTRCTFYLLVDQLSTVRSGEGIDNTPCCTTLPSVRMKICQTWRSLFGQEDSDSSQTAQWHGYDLSQLLDEWEREGINYILEEARKMLLTPLGRPASPQPSTSSCDPPPLPRSLRQGCMGWAADRVKWKGDEQFRVPVAHLLIPLQESLQQQTPSDGSETQSGLILPPERKLTGSPPASQQSNTPQSDVNMHTEHTVVLERIPPAGEDIRPQESVFNEPMVSGLMGEHCKDSPWDIFPPPSELLSESLSSEDLTPDDHPNQQDRSRLLAHSEVPVELHPLPAAMTTSMQIPAYGRSGTQKSQESKGDQSCLPPYQRPGPSTSSNEAPRSPSVTPPGLDTSSGRETSIPHLLPASDQEQCIDAQDEVMTRRSRTVKRKRSRQAGSEALSEEELQRATSPPSPPSWLFDSQADIRGEVGSSHCQAPTGGTLQRQSPTVHTDGTPFSYSYKRPAHVSQALREFKVPDAMLHWAVKYLLPQKAEQQSPGSGFLS